MIRKYPKNLSSSSPTSLLRIPFETAYFPKGTRRAKKPVSATEDPKKSTPTELLGPGKGNNTNNDDPAILKDRIGYEK